MKFPVVDYQVHPAFAPYAIASIYDDVFIGGRVDEIDRVFNRHRNAASAANDTLDEAVAEIAKLAGTIEQHCAAAGAPVLAREWLGSAFQWVIEDLRYELMRLAHCTLDVSGAGLDPSRRGQLEELRRAGAYRVALDQADYETICKLAVDLRPGIACQLDRRPNERAVHSPSRLSPLGRAIERALRNAGVLEVLSHFKANPLRILGTGLEYSRAQQSWYPGIYADVNLADSPVQYLHVDESDHLPKAMIYATPVFQETGPTGFVPGSNNWVRSEFLFRVHKGLDKVTIGRFGPYVRGGVYRATVREPELRRIFMQLPAVFQGSSHLGDDILSGTDLARELAAREERFMPEGRAEAFVFDGARCLHRGGLVREGDRLAMQVAFVNRNDARIKGRMAGGGKAAALARRVKQIARSIAGI